MGLLMIIKQIKFITNHSIRKEENNLGHIALCPYLGHIALCQYLGHIALCPYLGHIAFCPYLIKVTVLYVIAHA